MEKMFTLKPGRLPQADVKNIIFFVRPRLELMDIITDNVLRCAARRGARAASAGRGPARPVGWFGLETGMQVAAQPLSGRELGCEGREGGLCPRGWRCRAGGRALLMSWEQSRFA